MKEVLNDQNDFLSMFDKYHKVLFNFIYFQLNRNVEVAQDLTQDVFIKAWEKRSLFDQSKGTLKNWLYAIARNIVVDFCRDNKLVNMEDEFFESVVAKDHSQDIQILKHYLLRALNQLEHQDRELIILRYIQGYDVLTVSEIFQLSYSNTKVKIHRAMEKLKSIVNNEGIK